MNNRKIQIAIIIVIILSISFFWGSNKDIKPLSSEDIDENKVISIKDINTEGKENIEKKLEDKIKTEDKKTKESEKNELELNKTEREKLNEEEIIKKNAKEEIKTEDKKTKEQAVSNDSKNTGKKDQYGGDSTAQGKLKPLEGKDASVKKETKLTATLSVNCKTILNNMDLFDKDKIDILPEGGIIYASKEIEFFEDESVFDILYREMKKNKIHMEFTTSPLYNSKYIEGINNIYEFDCGELSGWNYRVNNWFPNHGASSYKVKNGDKIEWIYTCDLGRDINGGSAITQTPANE